VRWRLAWHGVRAAVLGMAGMVLLGSCRLGRVVQLTALRGRRGAVVPAWNVSQGMVWQASWGPFGAARRGTDVMARSGRQG
jgi:hypothetical protein